MQRVISQCSQIACHTPYDLPYHMQPFFCETNQVHTPIKIKNREWSFKVVVLSKKKSSLVCRKNDRQTNKPSMVYYLKKSDQSFYHSMNEWWHGISSRHVTWHVKTDRWHFCHPFTFFLFLKLIKPKLRVFFWKGLYLSLGKDGIGGFHTWGIQWWCQIWHQSMH